MLAGRAAVTLAGAYDRARGRRRPRARAGSGRRADPLWRRPIPVRRPLPASRRRPHAARAPPLAARSELVELPGTGHFELTAPRRPRGREFVARALRLLERGR